jgi:hypothetical protein
MFKFKQYLISEETLLVEGRGEETAHSGFANEHFTNEHINNYISHVKKGGAHETGMNKIKSAKFDHTSYKGDHPIARAVKAIGKEEVGKIHEDSKSTAHAIINHMKDTYGSKVTGSHHVGKVGAAGAEEVKKLTGKPSNADVVISTNHPKRGAGHALAHLEHIGASLKYSKASGGDVKIHSPSITNMGRIIDDHHEQMHGKSAGVGEKIKKAAAAGVAAQKKIVKAHAVELGKHFSSKEFTQNKNPKHVKKYLGKVGSASDYKAGVLNKAGISYIGKNEKTRHIYDKLAVENLKMKKNIAGHLHTGISAVLDHKSSSPKHKAIKESLVRSIGNVHPPEKSGSLPTFLVSTERGKQTQIHDVTAHFAKHLAEHGPEKHSHTKGASTFKVGPTNLAIDARPTTNTNPLNNPINVSVSSAALKKK